MEGKLVIIFVSAFLAFSVTAFLAFWALIQATRMISGRDRDSRKK